MDFISLLSRGPENHWAEGGHVVERVHILTQLVLWIRKDTTCPQPFWALRAFGRTFLLLGGAVGVALFQLRSLRSSSRLWQPEGVIVHYS